MAKPRYNIPVGQPGGPPEPNVNVDLIRLRREAPQVLQALLPYLRQMQGHVNVQNGALVVSLPRSVMDTAATEAMKRMVTPQKAPQRPDPNSAGTFRGADGKVVSVPKGPAPTPQPYASTKPSADEQQQKQLQQLLLLMQAMSQMNALPAASQTLGVASTAAVNAMTQRAGMQELQQALGLQGAQQVMAAGQQGIGWTGNGAPGPSAQMARNLALQNAVQAQAQQAYLHSRGIGTLPNVPISIFGTPGIAGNASPLANRLIDMSLQGQSYPDAASATSNVGWSY